MPRDGITKVVSPLTGKQTYRARISYTSPDGERHHRSKTFKTRKAAERWRRDTLASIDRGDWHEPAPATVAEVASAWLDTVERGKAPSTLVQYESVYRQHVFPKFGKRKIAAVRPTDVQSWYDELGRTYRAGTVKQVHKVMRGIMGHAIADGLIRNDPTSGRRLPRDRAKLPDAWTVAEVRQFLQVIDPEPDAPLFAVLVTTGLRLGEARALHWEDVDLDARTIHVHRTAQVTPRGTMVADQPKTAGSVRTVALTATAVLALHRQRSRELPGRLVFPSRVGGVASAAHIRNRLSALCEAADVPVLTPHGLRKTAATMMIRQGVPIATAARQLGHSVQILLQLYTAVSQDDQAEAARALDDALAR